MTDKSQQRERFETRAAYLEDQINSWYEHVGKRESSVMLHLHDHEAQAVLRYLRVVQPADAGAVGEPSKAEKVARERLEKAGDHFKVGSDLHLCEMLLMDIDKLRTAAPSQEVAELRKSKDLSDEVIRGCRSTNADLSRQIINLRRQLAEKDAELAEERVKHRLTLDHYQGSAS